MTPQQLANEARAAERRFRFDAYCTLRGEGKTRDEAAAALVPPIAAETARKYERQYQALLAAPGTSRPQQAGQVTAEAGAVTSPAPPPDDAPTPPASAGEAAAAPPDLLIPCPEGPAADETPAATTPASASPDETPIRARLAEPQALKGPLERFAGWLSRLLS